MAPPLPGKRQTIVGEVLGHALDNMDEVFFTLKTLCFTCFFDFVKLRFLFLLTFITKLDVYKPAEPHGIRSRMSLLDPNQQKKYYFSRTKFY